MHALGSRSQRSFRRSRIGVASGRRQSEAKRPAATDSRAAVGRMTHGTADRKGGPRHIPARGRRLGQEADHGRPFRDIEASVLKQSRIADGHVRSDVSTGGSGWRDLTAIFGRE